MEQWQVVTSHTSILGEGPVWDSAQNRILWVDIEQGHIHQYFVRTGVHRIFETGARIGAIALRKSGGLIAAMQNGFALIDLEKSIIENLSDPEAHLPENRFNDGKCDPAGRFWAGTMSVQDTPGAGRLYVLESNYSVTVKSQHVTCSNGIAWSVDGLTMYYIDTPTRQVLAFDYDFFTGNISNERVVVEVPEEDGFPDGMTIDTEGMLWIGMWDGWKVARYNPETGKRIHQLLMPVARVTSCTFGGQDLGDLFITTARSGFAEEELAKQPLAGCLFVIRNSGFRGLETSVFKG